MSNYPISIKMLMTLSNKELTKFNDYITSSYFNKSERIIKLFKYIQKCYILKKENKYNELTITKKNYGTCNKTNIRKLRYDLSKLKEHFEDFLSIQEFRSNELKKKIARLEDFIFRAKGAFFETEYKNINKKLSSEKCDSEFFHYRFKTEKLKSNFEIIYNDKRVGDVNLQLISDNIDKDFITKRLTYSVVMLNRSNIASYNYDYGLNDVMIKYLDNFNIKDPIIQCLFYAYKILANLEREKNYIILKELLNQYQSNLAEDIVNILYIILQNNLYYVFTDKKKYWIEFFELYSILLEQGLMRVNGKISAQIIKNIVTVCLELNKYEYLEKFLLDNRHQIYPEILSDDIFNFNFSRMLLYKGEVENAFDMITQVRIKDLYYKLSLRRLELMICYEMKNYRHMDYLVDAFRVALTPSRAKNISKRKLEGERNFINYFLDIFRISSKRNSGKKYIETLLQNITEATNVSDQKWLLMKVEALLNK